MPIPYTFRRLTTPPADASQYVPPPTVWPYINNIPGGDQAPVDTSETGSTRNNPGSYFVAFQDDAYSALANRPHQVLAMNTDKLDELLRRGIAYPEKISVVIPDVVTPSEISISSGYVWTGTSTSIVDADDICKLLVNAFMEPILDKSEVFVGQERALVGAITKNGVDVLGQGFVEATALLPVVFTFIPFIPAGNYWLYYYACSSFATVSAGGLCKGLLNPARITAATVGALREISGYPLYIPGTPPPQDVYSTFMFSAQKGLDGCYAHTMDVFAPAPPDTFWPDMYGVDLPGAGGWVRRTGPAISVYSTKLSTQTHLDPNRRVLRSILA
jgi:hypothetical protein